MSERYRLEWAPVALGDLDEILKYIAARDCVPAAVVVYENLMRKIAGLATHPVRSRIPPELEVAGVSDFRELVAAPYSVCFRVRGDSVGIVAVFDRRRDLQELLLQRVLRTPS